MNNPCAPAKPLGYVNSNLDDERLHAMSCGCVSVFACEPVRIVRQVHDCEVFDGSHYVRNCHTIMRMIMATYGNDALEQPIRWQ